MNKLFVFFHGYVRIKVEGADPERFMNLCIYKGVFLWNICYIDRLYYINVEKQFLNIMKECAGKSGCRFVILQEKGLPYWLRKLFAHPGYMLGLIGTVLWIISTTFFIWRIQIDGNRMISDDMLYQVLSEYKIHIGIPAKLVDPNELGKILRGTFDEFTWVSVSKNGMTLLIEVKEKDVTECSEKQKALEESGNLISPYDGSIYSIITRTGVPKVTKGQEVQQGMTLVEGAVPTYDEDGNVKEILFVQPDADIKLNHVLHFEERLDKKYLQKVFTGRRHKSVFLRICDKSLYLPWDESYYKYDKVICNRIQHAPDAVKRLFSLEYVICQEYQEEEHLYSLQEAKSIFSEKINTLLETLQEKGVQIIQKDVKIETYDDHWKMEASFHVIESLGKEAFKSIQSSEPLYLEETES